MGNAQSGEDNSTNKREQSTAFDTSLDISEILPRLIVVGLPYNGTTSRQSYRNNVSELANHLDERYGVGQWLVFNLASEKRTTYDAAKLRSQVACFRPALEEEGQSALDVTLDDGLPMIGCDLFRIVYAVDFWLRLAPRHVAVLHDINSKMRAGAACAAYMTWRHNDTYSEAFSAFDVFRQRRGLTGDARLPRTWRNALMTFTTTVASGKPAPPRQLLLERILIEMQGDVCAMQDGVIVQVYVDGECLWDSYFADSDEFLLAGGSCKCVVNRLVAGDVLVCVSAEVPIFRTPHVVPTPLGEMPDMRPVADLVESRTT